MLVAADHAIRGSTYGASQKLVILGIVTDFLRKARSNHQISVDNHKVQEATDVDTRMRRGEFIEDFSILVENLGGKDDLNLAIAPRLKDSAGNSAEEDAGHENIRIENDPHPLLRFAARRLRTLATA